MLPRALRLRAPESSGGSSCVFLKKKMPGIPPADVCCTDALVSACMSAVVHSVLCSFHRPRPTPPSLSFFAASRVYERECFRALPVCRFAEESMQRDVEIPVRVLYNKRTNPCSTRLLLCCKTYVVYKGDLRFVSTMLQMGPTHVIRFVCKVYS